jgi:hypothetical protein
MTFSGFLLRDMQQCSAKPFDRAPPVRPMNKLSETSRQPDKMLI